MNKEERKLKLPLLLGAFPFLIAGFDGISQGNVLLGSLNLVMSATNLIALRFAKRAPGVTNLVIHLANAGLACVVSYDYFLQGKKGLPYAWIVVAIAFAVAAVIFYRKGRQATGR